MPRISISDKDIERGKRFREIMKSHYRKATIRSIAKAFGGYSTSRVFAWRNGAAIDNRVLVQLAREGVDIYWLLTGERAADRPEPECHHGKLCERLPMLLRLLAEMFEETADPEKRETVIAALQGAIAATEADKQGKKGSA